MLFVAVMVVVVVRKTRSLSHSLSLSLSLSLGRNGGDISVWLAEPVGGVKAIGVPDTRDVPMQFLKVVLKNRK